MKMNKVVIGERKGSAEGGLLFGGVVGDWQDAIEKQCSLGFSE